MKPTTTPNGATLMWLEAGDTLAQNDVYDDNGLEGVVTDSPWPTGFRHRMRPGVAMRDHEIALFRPRRYIPLAE